ncbi:SIR2 family protein [Magnetospirillum moscoviense]|uniref:Transcriptional regulator n=1 Tax=Magnetospirillum moscoviense TaxID=1437059 RepID=A0A178MCC4_9PROT|nr:SIR2 family protein [Magnetospirillum moscoviense]MBF0323741.1 SIR2 family protein [Alphaproteobacteria bacterium]OAN46409.1 transcriptional regulator [Magnetospirillum moscoviense]
MNAAATLKDIVSDIGHRVAGGQLIPFLGPEVLTLSPEACPVPVGARDLAHLLSSRVAVPGRIRNNLWHTAQYIETFRHRVTLDKLMLEVFKPVPAPSVLHSWLAAQPGVPLIVDTWYDGTLAQCLAPRADWALIQGTSKARRTGDAPWYRAYGADGTETTEAQAAQAATVLYKPHGAAQPAGDVLASDADYVEVLTDIDLGLPIPQAVKDRRKERGFVFLGCRFYDQILRTFARSIIKHSSGPRFAVVPVGDLTRNELKFLEVEGITPIDMSLAEVAALFAGATP